MLYVIMHTQLPVYELDLKFIGIQFQTKKFQIMIQIQLINAVIQVKQQIQIMF